MGKNMVAVDKARYESCIYWAFRGTGVSRTVVRCTPNHASQPLWLDCSDCSPAIGSLHTQFAPNDLRQQPLLSFHPCLTLVSGVLTGPGPSLRARFAARPSPVLRPDPSPWRLCPHFPLTVIAGISSTRFLRRAPRASPVSTSSFTPCRR